MKKIKYFIVLTILPLLTGCVKENIDFTINKDRSLDYKITFVIDSSLVGEDEMLSDEEKKEMEDMGFTISDYEEDNMKGYIFFQKINNIDNVSSEDYSEFNLSDGIYEEKNTPVFKIEKGLLKNTYTAKFVLNPREEASTITDNILNTEENMEENDDDFTTWSSDDEDSMSYDDSDWTYSNDSSLSDDDLNSLLNSGIEMKMNVNLPYAAVTTNAPTINNDGKTLTWDLSSDWNSSDELNYIEFQFELYNMTNIYIGIGIIVVLILIVVIVLMNNIKKKKKNNSDGVQNPQTVNPQAPADGSQVIGSQVGMEPPVVNQDQVINPSIGVDQLQQPISQENPVETVVANSTAMDSVAPVEPAIPTTPVPEFNFDQHPEVIPSENVMTEPVIPEAPVEQATTPVPEFNFDQHPEVIPSVSEDAATVQTEEESMIDIVDK